MYQIFDGAFNITNVCNLISIHDTNLQKDIENSIKEVLNEKPHKVVNFEDETRYVAHNSNRPYFILYQTTDFISSAKKGVKNNKWQFHRSNSTLAHKESSNTSKRVDK